MHCKHLNLILAGCILSAMGCGRLAHNSAVPVDRAEWDSKAGMGLTSMPRASGLVSLERVALAGHLSDTSPKPTNSK